MERFQLRRLLESFYAEDIGSGDQTSSFLFDGEQCEAVIKSKAAGLLAGTDVITEGFRLMSEGIQISLQKRDGDSLSKGEPIAVLQGPAGAMLTGERVVLNLLQRMSAIATQTRQAIRLLDDEHTRICDTRKTMPGLRMLDKYAVRVGGGYNHRFGLYDGIMIKDNHIAACGSITEAVRRARSYAGHMIRIEVEIESEAQLLEAIAAQADVIMFDNRSPEEVKHFASLTPGSIITEASGGITFNTLHQYRGTGVNYISLGFLTHSVHSLDISMDVELR
ncbi:carboxylating nicotinate-nucleotide diphosphorylase [Paenibacillus sp. MER 180]|uniref:carboxylating nicotinate-nucleotide diphosphorylase n=1 Tax=unclassified Paenibacillus TaxID=185978 RepID=UPI000806618F|nr:MULTISPECIES: carboxylating nicotinate-nucleotide diphosphorylase [unclassified Paenibacillus]MCM3292669.1 carboxylating nicotinate-nucleotide diphosphorylase [Paenibacillus sp. MER 180]OBY81544.1 nicotinate-nucleotide diphosphorylase (carboxylating) [Paenibacillus sp. KS1]